MNPNCDGDKCTQADEQVCVLPLVGGANVHLCNVCYKHEMTWRKQRNLVVSESYDLPEWEDLEIYG